MCSATTEQNKLKENIPSLTQQLCHLSFFHPPFLSLCGSHHSLGGDWVRQKKICSKKYFQFYFEIWKEEKQKKCFFIVEKKNLKKKIFQKKSWVSCVKRGQCLFVHPTAPQLPSSHPSASFGKGKKRKNQISVLNYYYYYYYYLCACVCVCVITDCATTKSSPHDPNNNNKKRIGKKAKREAVVIFHLFVFASFAIHLPKFVFFFFFLNSSLKRRRLTFPSLLQKPPARHLYMYIQHTCICLNLFIRGHKLDF
jgi:hypothetical protein